MTSTDSAPVSSFPTLAVLQEAVVECRACRRLVEHREQIGQVRRKAYRTQEYWSRAVPSFGDGNARLLVVGLAPGEHGANRTGRMFTGDKSGDFLYRALHEAGFANQPTSDHRQDGLVLRDAYITAPVRCVPPGNRPQPDEVARCRPFFRRELELLPRVQVVVALGRIALDAYLSVLQDSGRIASRASFPFAHGARFETDPGGPALLLSYHPSQQNTSTKRLTREMLAEVFFAAKCLLAQADAQGTRAVAQTCHFP